MKVRSHWATVRYCTVTSHSLTCRINIEDDGNAVVSRGQELIGGQPHHREEGQQVGLQLHHRHPVAGISQPDTGVVANLNTHKNKESEVDGSGVSSPRTLANTRFARIRHPYLCISPSQSSKISLKVRRL